MLLHRLQGLDHESGTGGLVGEVYAQDAVVGQGLRDDDGQDGVTVALEFLKPAKKTEDGEREPPEQRMSRTTEQTEGRIAKRSARSPTRLKARFNKIRRGRW